jgi:hypothetical protein
VGTIVRCLLMKKLLSFCAALIISASTFSSAAFAVVTPVLSVIDHGGGEVTPGQIVEQLYFEIDTEDLLEIESMRFAVTGEGYVYVDNLELVDAEGNVLGRGQLDVNEEIQFHLDEEIEDTAGFTLKVETSRDAEEGEKFGVDFLELKLRNADGDPFGYAGDNLPKKGIKSVFNDEVLAGLTFVEARLVEDPPDLLIAQNTLLKVFVFELVADKPLELDQMSFGVIGDLRDRIHRVEFYTEDGNNLQTVGSNLIVREDVMIDEEGVRFYVYLEVNDRARLTHQGQIWLEDLRFDEEVEVTGVPLYGPVFEVTELHMNPDDPSDLIVEIDEDVDIESDLEEDDEDEFEEELTTSESNNPFSDIDQEDVDELGPQAAIYLSSKDIIRGYLVDESTLTVEFRGENQLNRAEAVKFIINSMELDDGDLCDNKGFPDAPTGQWYSKYVCSAIARTIVGGYGDGTFRPANLVTKAEFLKMLVVSHDLELDLDYDYSDVNDGEWFAKYVGVSQEMDLFPDEGAKFDPHKVLNRWETAIAVYTVLQAS